MTRKHQVKIRFYGSVFFGFFGRKRRMKHDYKEKGEEAKQEDEKSRES